MSVGRGLMAAFVAATTLAGCTSVEVQPQSALPPPLIEQLPVTVGVHYSEEFRNYVYSETRYQIEYEINLGPAHVAKLTRLLEAMFARVVEVQDMSDPRRSDPEITMVLEPRFEDYAFLTPRDMAGEAYTVTIRYRLNLYEPGGERVDGYVFTGYGREKSGMLTGSAPLVTATQRAMRDAGAKLAVELPEQEAVRLLLAGEPVQPKPTEEQQRREALGSFGDAPAVPVSDTQAPAGEAAPGVGEQSVGAAGEVGAGETSAPAESASGTRETAEGEVESGASAGAEPGPADEPAAGA